jgi:hypothetical protein
VATAASIFIVRQVPSAEALHSATRLRAIYVAAALAGLGGALAGRARAEALARAAGVSFAVAATACWPRCRRRARARPHVPRELAPADVHPITHAAVAPRASTDRRRPRAGNGGSASRGSLPSASCSR